MPSTDRRFNGSMSSDTDPNMQNKENIEDALNFPIVHNAFNGDSQGKFFQARMATPGTMFAYSSNSNRISTGYEPIMFVNYADKLIIISSNNRPGISISDGGHGEIGIATINKNNGMIMSYESLYNSEKLKLSIEHLIKGLFYYENEKTGGLYFTDDNNPPRTINIYDQRFYGNIASGSLETGKRYMVVYGNIVHSGNNYGVHRQSTDFVASSTTYTISGAITPKIIPYVSPEILDWIPKVMVGEIDFLTYLPGTLMAGGYQIFYQLVTYDGGSSNWFSIAGMNTPAIGIGINPSSGNLNWGQYQGGLVTEQTNKGLRFLINNIDQNYEKIRVAAVRYTSEIAKDVPFIFYESSITGTSMQIDLISNSGGQDISFGDLIAIGLNLSTVRDFDFGNNLNLPANITVSKDYGIDTAGVVAKECEYLFPGDSRGHPENFGSETDSSATTNLHGTSYASTAGVTYIYAFQYYRVQTGLVTYNGNVYGPGMVFRGDPAATSFSASGGSVVIAIIRIKKYGNTYKDIDINSDYMDNKGMAMNKYMKSRWRDETYRYGICLWSLQGNPMYVRWLADKKAMPVRARAADIDPDNGLPYGFDGNLAIPRNEDTDEWYLRHLGVEFDGLDFTSLVNELGITVGELNQYFSGFSIVRAVRDKVIIGEGLWCCTVQKSNVWSRGGDGETLQDRNELIESIKAYAEFHPLDNRLDPEVQRRPFIYAWYSPEQLFDDGGKFNAEQGDEVRIEDYLSEFGPYDPGIPGRSHSYVTAMAPTSAYSSVYSKMYQSNNETTVTNTFIIGGVPYTCVPTPKGTSQPISDPQYAVPFNPDPNTFLNYPSPTELYGFGLFDNAPQERGVANMGLAVVTSYDENRLASPADYRLGFGYFTQFIGENESEYGTGSGPGMRPMRPLVSWVRKKGSLYGGNTEQAKANTQYIFSGHYQSFDSDFLTYLAGNGNVADGIQVFGGDTFVNFIDFNQSKLFGEESKSSTVIFPCQSSLNIALRRGRTVSKDWTYLPGTNENGVSFLDPQQPEEFLYNYGYSGEDREQTFPALPVNYQNNTEFRYRALYSNVKISGEPINQFRKFPVGQYRDVTGSFGPIANVRHAGQRLFYWQENGCVGYISINERQTINGQSGTPTILGTTGTMTFYEELDKFFGSQHTFGISDTPDGWAWIDARMRTMLFMPFGGKPQEVTTGKGYLRELFNTLTGGIYEDDAAAINKGLIGFYNRERRESIFVFKNTTSGPMSLGFDWINKGLSTRYSLKTAVASYNFPFGYTAYSGLENLMQANTLYQEGQLIAQNGMAVFGGWSETVLFDIYVNILSYTTGSVFNQPSNDPTHWKKVCSSNDIDLLFRGDTCKFHGVVYPWSMQFIVNDFPDMEKFIDCCEIVGNENIFDFAQYTNEEQIGLDTDVLSMIGADYQKRDTKWYFNIPRSQRGDYFVGTFLRFFWRRKNYDTDRTVSDNKPVKIVSLKTEIRDAR